ncbi:cyclic peptide export ABC transporter [Kordia jejudonensis]|uniref:cyclic peptide export ABC transporter n=1 Tax=Kordia jejudonensis TaxID=1348245 RepID=UPI0006298A21|nr:cyclic peptide export ABC transporter [Kordia jejudonensis]
MQLFKISTKQVFYLLMYSLLNSVLSFVIIFIINNALSGNPVFLKSHMGFVFLGLVVYTYLLNIVFQKYLNKYVFLMLYNNEKKLFRKMLQTPLNILEKLGTQRFFTAVEDLRTFSLLPYTVTHTVNSLLMLILCLIYMFSLSVSAALIVIGLVLVVAFSYFIVMNSMSKHVEKLRSYNDYYYKYVQDVMKGFKELKLNFFRRKNLMNKFLFPNRDQAGVLDFKINYVFLSINLISQYGLYFVITTILFLLPEWGILNREDIIAYVVIILFISGPINNLINLQQMYTRFMVARKRIRNFINDFQIQHDEVEVKSAASFQKINFDNIEYSYEQATEADEQHFVLGPINLEIKKGETIFIIGGNGSGKSTFIKTLTGLYEPTGGNIKLNDSLIDSKENIQNLVAAVFTNNHLFSQNYEDYELDDNMQYEELLKLMQMDTVVADTSDEASRRNFSKGQSKRMSLIFALLEKKPILVLDEWAADQDPHFRKYFYTELIPRLQKQGKTIIAVTHDDMYFEYADRIVKFDYGQIVKDIDAATIKELKDASWI